MKLLDRKIKIYIYSDLSDCYIETNDSLVCDVEISKSLAKHTDHCIIKLYNYDLRELVSLVSVDDEIVDERPYCKIAVEYLAVEYTLYIGRLLSISQKFESITDSSCIIICDSRVFDDAFNKFKDNMQFRLKPNTTLYSSIVDSKLMNSDVSFDELSSIVPSREQNINSVNDFNEMLKEYNLYYDISSIGQLTLQKLDSDVELSLVDLTSAQLVNSSSDNIEFTCKKFDLQIGQIIIISSDIIDTSISSYNDALAANKFRQLSSTDTYRIHSIKYRLQSKDNTFELQVSAKRTSIN